jgi:hypothetical protein
MRDGLTAAGQYVEVDPPHRLVFSWGWTHDETVAPGTTRVVVTLEEEDGGTLVVLRHHDLPDDGQRDHHRTGWETYLHRLAVRVPGAIPARTPTRRPLSTVESGRRPPDEIPPGDGDCGASVVSGPHDVGRLR